MEKLYKTKAITEGVFYTRNDACEEDEDLYTLSEIEFFAIDEEASDIDNKKINEIQESVINTETDNTLMMYLKEIGEHELLSPEEEIELAIRVRNGNFAREQKEDLIKEGFELSAVNLKELDDMIADGEEARETLINSNLKLVVFVAKKYAPVNGMELQDLIQEGNFGLMKAVDKFDPDRGFRFATFAVWWIRQAITRAIANTGRIVRIPVHMSETINKYFKIKKQLTHDLGREPTNDELIEKMGISKKRLKDIIKNAQDIISLETEVGSDGVSILEDLLEDKENDTPEQYTIEINTKKEIDEILRSLPEREEEVIRMRYGFYDNRIYTLEEIGERFGLTRERIRQIETKAMRKLKRKFEKTFNYK